MRRNAFLSACYQNMHMLKLLLLLVAGTFIVQTTVAQAPTASVKDTVVVQAGTFIDTVTPESPLYNGAEHLDYHPQTIGIPYFETLDWVNGTLYTNGLIYKNVPMKYDLVKDRVVIRHHNGFYKIELVSQQIDSFSMAGHSFLRLAQNKELLIPRMGFYEVVHTPLINLYIKRENRIIEFIDNRTIARRVEERTQLFADKEGKRFPINNLNSLLDLMPDHKKAVQRHLKKAGIRYRKNKVLAATTAVTYYNQLNNVN